MTKTMDRAITLAHEITRLETRSDVVLAEQARRTLDDLVGYRTPSGWWTLPSSVQKILRD